MRAKDLCPVSYPDSGPILAFMQEDHRDRAERAKRDFLSAVVFGMPPALGTRRSLEPWSPSSADPDPSWGGYLGC
jgi:hypothetical protein